MKNLVETYISQSPGSLAQVESARKAFKAELKNGPVKSVYYANGIQGRKAFGNFDLQLFHQAYDAELDAQGLLVHFDDHGLVNRNSYQAFKAATGECAKYAKELWVLQYGKSDYKLTNTPASSIPLTPEETLRELVTDPVMTQLFRYSVEQLRFSTGKYHACYDVFFDGFGTPEKLQQFLTATGLDKVPYETVKTNICSMFFCIVASEQIFREANNTHRQFFTPNAGRCLLNRMFVDYNPSSKVPVRIFIEMFSTQLLQEIYIRITPTLKLNAGEPLLNMPVYVARSNGFVYLHDPASISAVSSNFRPVDVPGIDKFAQINFRLVDSILSNY